MKTLIAILFAVTAFTRVLAQQPSPDPDTLQNPVKQIDPEVKQAPADIQYISERVRINADELPAPVQQNLRKMEPDSWQKSVVYQDKKTNCFIVEIREDGNEKVYHFDKAGKQLAVPDEDKDNVEGQGVAKTKHNTKKKKKNAEMQRD